MAAYLAPDSATGDLLVECVLCDPIQAFILPDPATGSTDEVMDGAEELHHGEQVLSELLAEEPDGPATTVSLPVWSVNFFITSKRKKANISLSCATKLATTSVTDGRAVPGRHRHDLRLSPLPASGRGAGESRA